MVTPHGYNAFFKIMLDNFADELVLPIKFVSTVIRQQEWKLVTLRSVLNKTWSIEVRKDADGSYKLSNGWKDFVEAHHLEFGYLLVFQYCGRMDFYVTVFDKSTCTKLFDVFDENEDSVKIKVEDEDLKIPMERKYLCRKQQFKVTIGACNHNKEKMRFPTCFVDSNDLLGIPRATLVCSGGSWSVKLCYHQHRNQTHISFGRGWCTFTSKNNLGEGDVCIFELLSAHENGVHFLVTKEMDMTRSATTASVKHGTERIQGHETSKYQRTKGPYFEVTIKRGLRTRTIPYVHIPATFSGLSYLASKSNVILEDTDGRSWKTVIFVHHLHNQIYPRLTGGWLKFCHDKNVEVGDVCIFELVSEGTDAKMMVHVHKKQVSQSIWYSPDIKHDKKNSSNGAYVVHHEDLNIREKRKGKDFSHVCKPEVIKRQHKLGESSKHQSVVMEKQNQRQTEKPKLEVSNDLKFTITLKACNLFDRDYLHFPFPFTNSNGLSEICKAALSTSNGCWFVIIKHVRRREMNRVDAIIRQGWAAFCRENNFRICDVLTFELVKKESNNACFFVTKVHCMPSKHRDKSTCDVSDTENSEPLEKKHIKRSPAVGNKKDITDGKGLANSHGPQKEQILTGRKRPVFKDSNLSEKKKRKLEEVKKSSFKVLLKPCNLAEREYLHIPSAFSRSNDLRSIHQVTLITSRCWSVRLVHFRIKNHLEVRFGNGWKIFWSENNLKAGDILTFELTNKEKNTMSFSVIKEQDSPSETGTNMHDVIDIKNCDALKSNSTHLRAGYHSKDENQESCSNELRASQNDEYIKERNIHGLSSRPLPQFTVIMKRKNLRDTSPYVNIPAAIDGSEFLIGTNRLIIANKKGQSWDVKLYYNHSERNASSYRMGTGWGLFAHENGLEMGDICNFKLRSKKGDTAVVYYEVFKKKQFSS